MSRLLLLTISVMCPGLLLAQTESIDGETLKDPTRPLFFSQTATGVDDEVLDMISGVIPSSYDVSFIRAGSAPMAVINNQRVSIGDEIGGAKVVAIDRSSVTLSVNDEERRVSLFDTSVKVPRPGVTTQ